jgi:FkbM family methyltransferase
MEYFFTRRLAQPIATPKGFLIETTEELVSYWSFFVERECLASEWVNVLLSEAEPVVVDVGANAGLFSYRIWTLKPGAKFILFEPLPRMAEKIAKWEATTGAACTLHNKAVSDYCGTATFFASSENDTTASLKPEPGKHLRRELAVVTLDSIIPDRPILVMKIDVEGSECEVLAGGRRTIERTRFLIIEALTKAASERIRNTLGAEWLDKQVGATDYLFMRPTERSPC